MERVVTATEARERFGELMRRVSENGETVIVERAGKEQVAVLPVDEYRRLQRSHSKAEQLKVLKQAAELGAQISARRGGKPLPPPEEVIRQMREERDEQLSRLSR